MKAKLIASFRKQLILDVDVNFEQGRVNDLRGQRLTSLYIGTTLRSLEDFDRLQRFLSEIRECFFFGAGVGFGNAFELGKYYEHTSGLQLHICGSINSDLHGEGFVAETGWNKAKLAERVTVIKAEREVLPFDLKDDGFLRREYLPISAAPGAAVNFKEIAKEVFISNNFSAT